MFLSVCVVVISNIYVRDVCQCCDLCVVCVESDIFSWHWDVSDVWQYSMCVFVLYMCLMCVSYVRYVFCVCFVCVFVCVFVRTRIDN